MKSDATTVDAYLAELPADRRAALAELRALIRELAPDAEEDMAHGMASYALDGPLFGLASQKGYMALYVSAPAAVDGHRDRLGALDCGKGCVRFKRLADLPLDAVRDILRDAVAGRRAGLRGSRSIEYKGTMMAESTGSRQAVRAIGTGKTATASAKAEAQAGAGVGDWREGVLDRMRALILAADPGMAEERKWRKASNGMAGVPVWSCHGVVCTGEVYKQAVKLTFPHGAGLPDPSGLFNAGLGGGARRAIDIGEGGTIDAVAFQALVRAAVARNAAKSSESGV